MTESFDMPDFNFDDELDQAAAYVKSVTVGQQALRNRKARHGNRRERRRLNPKWVALNKQAPIGRMYVGGYGWMNVYDQTKKL